jgi:type II secretory pathway component GspD/PulD (secretin)
VNLSGNGIKKRKMRSVYGVVLASALCASTAWAQTEPALQKDAAPARRGPDYATFKTQTFYLTNTSQMNEATEILTAIRNMIKSEDKVYLVPSQNAVIVYASPDDLLLTQKLISELDRPRRSYRLTYTINESDGGKRIGSQHFSMIVVSGQRTTLKQGSKVPIVTGSFNSANSQTQNQVTYIDIGLNFDATLDESVNGVRLRTKAEQSSILEDKSGVAVQDPVVRQTVLEGASILTPGKPLVLGSLDIPGSTRHQDVEVVMEVVR